MSGKFTNNASTTLAASINTTDTGITIASADAGKFPTLGAGEWFPLTVIDVGGNMEIMRVTARSGAALTVVRAQEATTAKAFASGARADLRMTAALLTEIYDVAKGDHTHTSSQITDLAAVITAAIALASPIAKIGYFALSAAPDGWIKANGGLISRTTYANLWAKAVADGNVAANDTVWASSQLYGQFSPGDGSTTFRIPDYRGIIHRVWDDGRGADIGRGMGTYQDSANRVHNHTGTVAAVGDHAHSINDPTHIHGTVAFQSTGGGLNAASAQAINSTTINTTASATGISINPAGGHAHGVTINNDGGAESRPQNVAVLACIKY